MRTEADHGEDALFGCQRLCIRTQIFGFRWLDPWRQLDVRAKTFDSHFLNFHKVGVELYIVRHRLSGFGERVHCQVDDRIWIRYLHRKLKRLARHHHDESDSHLLPRVLRRVGLRLRRRVIAEIAARISRTLLRLLLILLVRRRLVRLGQRIFFGHANIDANIDWRWSSSASRTHLVRSILGLIRRRLVGIVLHLLVLRRQRFGRVTRRFFAARGRLRSRRRLHGAIFALTNNSDFNRFIRCIADINVALQQRHLLLWWLLQLSQQLHLALRLV
mmetsp:Transcript_59932/g.98917  ORF Transcript_59932/g.98917 Transcript_59932/m.98917 type:complete len:274 (-) Transcript_59932:1596-2417(-)